MTHGIVTCDICGETGAKTCYFYVDRGLDAAGSMEDRYEQMDLCQFCTWKAYRLAEKIGGFDLANKVVASLREEIDRLKTKRQGALSRLPIGGTC